MLAHLRPFFGASLFASFAPLLPLLLSVIAGCSDTGKVSSTLLFAYFGGSFESYYGERP